MDWFESLLGFREGAYQDVQRQLLVDGSRLKSRVNGQSYGIGVLELRSLQELRDRMSQGTVPSGSPRVSCLSGNVRKLHGEPAFAGALFQVASQFNLLEMVSPQVTPEDGVTRYAGDPTQGPACAIAAGAATIYRNYSVPFDGGVGQTSTRQLDALRGLGDALCDVLQLPLSALWSMENGYALCTQAGLDAIDRYLSAASAEEADRLRGLLRIGLHWDVEVTDQTKAPRPIVSQAFCSALPVSYSRVPRKYWERFARLVLDAAYEATLLAAALNAARGGSNTVLLTRLGGGAFGNSDSWIDDAIARALGLCAHLDLDVRLVSYGAPPHSAVDLALRYPGARPAAEHREPPGKR